jgi:proline-specific peptidase
MAKITCKGYIIAYEIYGSNEEQPPLVILNGIMMSMASWQPFINSLTKWRQVILMDFFDQGESDTMEGEYYTHDLQVIAVETLMNELHYDEYDLFGISYGGQVALQVALKKQSNIRKLVVFNASSYTSPWLMDIGRGWMAAAENGDSEMFYYVALPYIYSNIFYNEQYDWMLERKEKLMNAFNENFLQRMIRLIKSSEPYDIRELLYKIKIPTMIVGADHDFITPENETRELSKLIKHSQYLVLPNTGHASMYENPGLFVQWINGFLLENNKINILTK